MIDPLAAQVSISPQKVALIAGDERFTYADLDRHVRGLMARLHGISAGDHVALYMRNSPEYVCAIFALMRLGAVIVPINTRLTVGEITWQIQNADCKHLLCDEENAGHFPVLDGVHARPVALTVEQAISPDLPTAANVALDVPFAIIHTSGTSGKPKGAILTYGNFFYSAMASAYRLGHRPDDVWLCTLPLFHVGGLSIIIRACLYGITVDLRQRFDVNEVNDTLRRGDATLVSLVPTMLYRLLEVRRGAWSDRLRLVLLGGAAADAGLIARCLAEGVPLATTYGLTEATSQVATTTPDSAYDKPGTVGKPLIFTQVRVVDENGGDQPAGIYGAVVVRGQTVMRGYYNDLEATAWVLRDGWLYTGDIGYLDADGDLFIVQRRSDLIVSGGENIYPAEVEAVLKAHPAVKEAVVIGLPDVEWGQKVVAVAQLHPNANVAEPDLIAHCRQHLAGYKQPRQIRLIDDLPQTASGKIQRHVLAEMLGIT